MTLQSPWLIALIALLGMNTINAEAGSYSKIKHDGTTYHAFVAEPEEIQIHLKAADGTLFRKLDTLAASLEAAGRKIEFIGNAGIFMEGGMPLGLYLENGKRARRTNEVKDAYGNFYLQPNGIFFIEGDKASVKTTDGYLAGNHSPRLATQSGPMLLIDGKIHPKFMPDSPNGFYRNGVGILPDGKVLFMITDHSLFNSVNLHGFASAFAAQGCKNALFLDGGLSAVRIPSAKVRIETGVPLGPMLSITKSAAE